MLVAPFSVVSGSGSVAWLVPCGNVVLFPIPSYEDLGALDGGTEGMRVIKTILALAPSLLKDSG